MMDGLLITCSEQSWRAAREGLRARGIALEEQAQDAADRTKTVRRAYLCRRRDETLELHTRDTAEYPNPVQVVLAPPPVSRTIDLLLDVRAVIHDCGGRNGPPDGFRCACGYCLYHNTSGRCPECGTPIPVPIEAKP